MTSQIRMGLLRKLSIPQGSNNTVFQNDIARRRWTDRQREREKKKTGVSGIDKKFKSFTLRYIVWRVNLDKINARALKC